MNCYVISYDLRKVRDYESLKRAIRSYGNWANILESLWAIKSNTTAIDIANHLKQFMDNDDGIFVIKSGVEAAWINVICDGDRLQTNLYNN